MSRIRALQQAIEKREMSAFIGAGAAGARGHQHLHYLKSAMSDSNFRNDVALRAA